MGPVAPLSGAITLASLDVYVINDIGAYRRHL
jgi:hypothetical protein